MGLHAAMVMLTFSKSLTTDLVQNASKSLKLIPAKYWPPKNAKVSTR